MAAVWLHATNLSSRLHGTASPKERHWPQACTPASSRDSSHERTCSAKEQQGHQSARKRFQERLCSATTPLPTTNIQRRTRSGGGSEAVARSTSSSKLGDTMPILLNLMCQSRSFTQTTKPPLGNFHKNTRSQPDDKATEPPSGNVPKNTYAQLPNGKATDPTPGSFPKNACARAYTCAHRSAPRRLLSCTN